MHRLDMSAIRDAAWGEWHRVSSQEAAVAKIKQMWPEIVGQSDDKVFLMFAADPNQDVHVGTVRPAGDGWEYRLKVRVLEK